MKEKRRTNAVEANANALNAIVNELCLKIILFFLKGIQLLPFYFFGNDIFYLALATLIFKTKLKLSHTYKKCEKK